MKSDYTLLDHTADIGIEIEAETLPQLFQKAGEALCDLMCDRDSIACKQTKNISLQRDTLEELLQAFLTKLLYFFDADHELFSEVRVEELSNGFLKVQVVGEVLDPNRHEIKLGIKAVTYHQLCVTQRENLWKARIIFDV